MSFTDMDNGSNSSDCFCELCSLDFTTQRELEEHTWSILHNTNLNRKQGRDCVHPCSLCKEQFIGLLEFTSHLHGENHQEKLHNWRKDQQQELSPEKQEWHSPDEKQIQSPCNKDNDRLPSDLVADNLSGERDFQDSTSVQSGESTMNDNRWGSGHGRVSTRNIPSLLDDLAPVGYHYPEQLEMRRGLQSNQPWENERWRDERGYPNDGPPMWDGGQRETYREFRDGPWYNPVLEGMDDPGYHGNRDDDRYYSSRDSPRPYPNDHFTDGYAPGLRQRDYFGGDSGFRPRYDDHRPDLRERITRRNSNSSHPTHKNNGQQKMKSVVVTYTRGSRRQNSGSSSQRHTPPSREDKGRRTSLETTKRDCKDKSQPKNSPSESPSGKSARKSKPRKLARSEEKKKDDSNSGNAGTKGNELERRKREETAVIEKGKSATESASASTSQYVVADEKSKSSNSISEGTASSIKHMADPKDNTSSSSRSSPRSSAKRNSHSSVKGVLSPPRKKCSTSASKKDSSSPTKGDPSSPSKGTPPSWTKRNSTSSRERDSSSASKRDSSSSAPPSSTKENSTSFAKAESSSSTKGVPSLSVKGDSSSSAKGDLSSSIKGDFLLTAKRTVQGESSPTVKENSSLSKESEDSSAKGVSSLAKGDSAPSLGGSSLVTAKEKEDIGKASNILRDSLSSLKNKDKLTSVSSKKEGELILPLPEKETLVTSLNNENKLSQEEVNTLPVVSDKSTDMPLPKMGEVSLPSTGEKTDQASSASSFSRDTSSSLATNGKEKTIDNQAANISGEGKQNDLTSSSAASTFVGSLPWEKREEELRALLGIKKEPKDDERQEGNIPCNWPKSNQVSAESQTNRPVSSSSILSTVNSLTAGSDKSPSSRYLPVVSQLSLSRPQCSFVHIDGVQCGAVTWNKYCSYHQRVFNSEETNAQKQSLVSEGSRFERTDGSESGKAPRGISRPGISQIFKPTTPPFDPPKRFGVDGSVDAISGVKTDQSLLSRNKNDLQQEGHKENEEIDLSSTVSYTALGAAGGPHRNIDLSTTVRGATRSLLLNGPSTDVTSEPRIDLSSTVPKLGRTLEPHGVTLDSNKIEQGIDLSGTVPNLEELLALHGLSADKSSGPIFDPSKNVLKHGRPLNHQSSSVDKGPNIDLGGTVPFRVGPRHLSCSSVASDNAPSIDLNETVSQPGRSRTPLDTGLKDAHTANFERFVGQPATASSGIPYLKDDVSQKCSLTTGPHRESTSASPTPNVKTEMIDLNFSTKLLGVPHSVVTPFNTSVPSPQKTTREITKSPSEFSTTSSISASRNYVPSSPQNRRVSSSSMPGEQSPVSTASLPNLSLDLSRFNLPPAVRKALAERYSGRKVPIATSSQSAEFPEGRRSQPLFTDHTRNEGVLNEQGKKLSPLPARLRGRGQRSVSLDSPMVRKENLRGENPPRSGLLERGNIYDTNRFLSRPFGQTSEGRHQTGLSASDRISEGLVTRSSNVPPSSATTNELQSRGLIDLSSTSYLQGLSVPPSIQERPTEATRTTIDNSRSPARPSMLQSRGLIDLNTTSTDFGSRDVAIETPEAFSVIKRKRVNSLEGSETFSGSGAETLVKRLKQDEASARDTVVTYRSGINVQQLLTIERDEQDQLQNLHTVQSRLKSVRAQIQKLCTELDSLSSEEQRITLKMGELRNMRLSILENACYDRQEQVARFETVRRESSTSTVDDNRTVPVSGGPEEGEFLEYDHSKVETRSNSSSPPTRSHNVTSCATERNDDVTSLVAERNNHGTLRAMELSDHVTSHSAERNDHFTSRATERNDHFPSRATERNDHVTSRAAERDNHFTSRAAERNDHVTSRATERNDRVTSRAEERNDHVTSRATERSDGYHGADTEEEKMAIEFDDGSTSHGGIFSTEEPLNTSRSSDNPMLESRVSVGTATRFVSRDQSLHNHQPREKEMLNVASKRSTDRRESYNDVDLNRGTNNVVQASRAPNSENTPSRELAAHQDSDPGSFDGGSERYVIVSETLGGPGAQKQNDPSRSNETRKDFMKKMRNMRLPKVHRWKESVSDVDVSKTIEASRKKIQSTRENMKRWREQELGVDLLGSNEDQKKKHGSSSSTESLENALEESGPSPVKIPPRDKTSNRKTTKELKKSSLFHSGKKTSKEARKNRYDKSHWKDKEKFKLEVAPSKRRKIDNTSCNKPSSVSPKEKTSANEKGRVVSAAAHTTTTDLGGSGTEERSSADDEIPTRDVDGQFGSTSSTNISRRPSHLQIPSSTVESLKKNMQNSKEGRQHRGPLPNTFSGHTGAVCGLKVHNGHLFTCSADKTTRSFNIQTGQCVKVYHGHHQAVNCIEVSVDKDRLFTGSNDQTVRSYNIKSGVCTHKFTLDGRVMCLHAAFDLLFVGLSTGVVASIDLLNNKCLERLHCHEPRGVSCLTTATEGQRKLLCSGSFDSTIAIRDCKSGLLLRTFSDHNMTVLCLQVVENVLYSGSADMKVKAHNLNSGELVRSFEGHTMSVSGLQVVGSVLVTSCLDKLIRCYDLVTAELLQVYGGQMDMIFSVHVNSGRIYSGARDGSVVSSKLDLRVYHPCKWRECNLNFGVVSHLKNHIRDYHVMEQGTVEACHWANCGYQFSTDDDISVVLKHVLGHVVSRTARKSAT